MISIARRAKIESVLDYWLSLRPSFLWAPTSQVTLLLDRATGRRGIPSGTGWGVGPGGIRYVAPNSNDSWIEFQTNFNLGTNEPHLTAAIVSVDDPASITGAFAKFGSGVNGIGFGAGNTTFDNSGGKAIMLYESLAWYTSGSAPFVSGLNCSYLGRTSESVIVSGAWPQVTEAQSSGSWLSADSQLRINGYMTARGSNAKVHALAVFLRSLSNADFVSFRSEVFRPLRNYIGVSRAEVDRLFTPQRRRIPVAGAAAPTTFIPSWVRQNSRVLGGGV